MSAWQQGPGVLLFARVLLLARRPSAFERRGQVSSPTINTARAKDAASLPFRAERLIWAHLGKRKMAGNSLAYSQDPRVFNPAQFCYTIKIPLNQQLAHRHL